MEGGGMIERTATARSPNIFVKSHVDVYYS
jgi:hypothetical protein